MAQSDRHIAARGVVERPGEEVAFVSVICNGWATATAVLPDGRRQILSVLLPGDFVSASYVFRARSSVLTEAVTDVLIRRFDRTTLHALVRSHPNILDIVVMACLKEQDRAAARMIGLGRRTASGRIATFILSLMRQLKKRGMVSDLAFSFPLRQQHIADALGLTTVHVSKIMGGLRRAGCIELRSRSLKVLDPLQLNRIAEM